MGPGGQLNKHILLSNGCLPIIYDTSMCDISTLGISICYTLELNTLKLE